MPDRRRHTRMKTLIGGRLIHAAGAFDGIVRNLSASGAMMACDNPARLPGRVTFLLPDKGWTREGWIVWRRLDSVGLAFF